jgi:outer membrane receptor protein involved in Fe transport
MRKRFAAASASLVLAFATTAHADDDTSLEGLLSEDIVTSVSKSAETSADAPAFTRNISAEDIRRYGMTSIDEALDFLGVGMHVEHGLNRSEVSVRGVAFAGDRGNHILLLLDGHVVNEPLFGDASFDQRFGVPLELIDHIEIALGPGSAMYGTNAVLAVVNVVTKSASANRGIHAAVETATAGSVRTTVTTGQSFDLLGKRTAFTAGLTYFHHDGSATIGREDLGVDPLTGNHDYWGGSLHHADRADDGGLYFRLMRDGLTVTGGFVVSSLGDPTGLGDFDQRDSGTLQRRARLAVAKTFALGRIGELTTTVYAKTFDERTRTIATPGIDLPFPGYPTFDVRENARSTRIGADLRANFDWLSDGRVTTTIGTSASFDHVSATTDAVAYATRNVITPTTDTIDIDSVFNVAANAQQTVKPFAWLDLIGGARLDWRQINDEQRSETFTPELTPRLAAAARPWAGGTAKIIYSEAFRAPNPFELDAASPTLLRSRGLEPEKTTSTEAVFEQRLSTHRLAFGLFRTQYYGIINRLLLTEAQHAAAYSAGLTPVPPGVGSPLYQYEYDDYIESHGFNAAVDGTFLAQRLHYGAAFTGTVARADHTDLISIAPEVFGKARVAYDLGGKLPTLALATTFAGKTTTDRGVDSGYKVLTMAPPSLEVRATATGNVPWVKGLSYRLIVAHQVHDRTPFAVGPVLRATSGFEAVPLTPSQSWNALFGLQYDFGQ